MGCMKLWTPYGAVTKKYEITKAQYVSALMHEQINSKQMKVNVGREQRSGVKIQTFGRGE